MAKTIIKAGILGLAKTGAKMKPKPGNKAKLVATLRKRAAIVDKETDASAVNDVVREVNTFGHSQVIVYLNPTESLALATTAPASSNSVKAIWDCFLDVETVAGLESLGARQPTDKLALGVMEGERLPNALHFPSLGVVLGRVDLTGFDKLRKRKGIVREITTAPALSLIRPYNIAAVAAPRKATWGIEFLGVPALWKRGLTGKGVIVGHLDTGADGNHPALQNAFAAFAAFDLQGRPVTPAPQPHDTGEHGSHTAATIAGRAHGANVVGVAPGAKLASAIVIEGGNAIARVLGGMNWAVGQGIRVLSMSLGFRGYNENFLPLTKILRARNILPVFAVGNEGPDTSRSPGNYVEALSVGAADARGQVASFSSSQRFQRAKDPIVPDLVGPGVDIISAAPGGGYQQMSGTSMATPHIAGLAALLLEAAPAATVDRLEKAIFDSCRLPAGMSPARGGRGVPNAARALEILGVA